MKIWLAKEAGLDLKPGGGGGGNNDGPADITATKGVQKMLREALCHWYEDHFLIMCGIGV